MSQNSSHPTGIHTPVSKPKYQTYQSPYGPKYKVVTNFRGWNISSLGRAGIMMGGFGAVAGVAALYLVEGVPRVQKDILQKVPFFGDYWIKEIPPSDNPF